MKNKLIKYKKGSLVQVRVGNILNTPYKEPAELISISLRTNGVDDPTIVAVFTVEFGNGNRLIATSNHFTPVIGQAYLEE